MSELAKAYVQIVPSAEGISSGLEEALGGEMDSAGKKSGTRWLGGAAKTIGAGVATVTAAAGAAVIGITKQSVAAYSEYEQLVGGVETLFSSLDGSASASETVMANAANAYKTAGLSANEYMETVTSFAAALTSSLGNNYDEAARVADMAITDMADNANKMGTDMESIQNAYQGFAKQNYTMLDNLKLGYGGTKSEMERLLADAEAFSGVHYDINNLNDVYEAIHVVQTELGITGTTAEEAASTIQGSTAAFKAAWDNLLVGMSDDEADMSTLVGNLVESFGAMFDNLAPTITTALGGIGTAIAEAMPAIAEQLPGLIDTLAPALATGINGLIAGVTAAMPSFITAVTTILPDLAESGIELVGAIVSGIAGALPDLATAAVNIIMSLVGYFTENISEITSSAIEIITTLATGLLDNLPQLVAASLELIVALAGAIIENLPEIAAAAVEILTALVNGILDSIDMLIDIGGQMISDIIGAFQDGSALEAGKKVVSDLWDGIKEIWETLVAWVTEKWNALISIFDLSGIGNKISEGWDNVTSGVSNAYNGAKEWAGNAWSTATSWLPGHADGLDYVPYDNYVARLHQGERVLTAEENKEYSGGGARINIYAQQLSQSDIDYVVEIANRRLGAAVI